MGPHFGRRLGAIWEIPVKALVRPIVRDHERWAGGMIGRNTHPRDWEGLAMKNWIWFGVGVWVVSTLVGTGLSTSALAQSRMYAYPMANQTQEMRDQDRWACHDWAVRQTGFDPTVPQPRRSQQYYASAPPPSGSSGPLGIGDGGMFRGSGALGDAATGAALGAIGGAIAGNAGKGAAIGALTTTLFGGIRRSNRRQQEEEWRRQQQANAALQQQQRTRQRQFDMQRYDRAWGACMSARNYRVQ